MRLAKRDSEGRKKERKQEWKQGGGEKRCRDLLCFVTKFLWTRDTNNTYKSIPEKVIARKCKYMSVIFRIKMRGRNSKTMKKNIGNGRNERQKRSKAIQLNLTCKCIITLRSVHVPSNTQDNFLYLDYFALDITSLSRPRTRRRGNNVFTRIIITQC